MIYSIEWKDDFIRILDQTRLPGEVSFIDCSDHRMVVSAISKMNIRGAPAIGIAAAMGISLGVQNICCRDRGDFLQQMDTICEEFSCSRPTAVNLNWAIKRLRDVAQNHSGSVEELKEAIKVEALKIWEVDIHINRTLGRLGETLVPDRSTILTHCNAGALATGGYGTALGVIRAAHEAGKQITVYVDETRPLLQGARLTAWELLKEGIPATLITDNMAGHFMRKGKVDLIIVGADRVVSNGDVANKIGTYSLSVLARAHKIPFYIAAPISSIDLAMRTGEEIPIEERNHEEVTTLAGTRLAPEGIMVANPAFDVTPHEYISAIITERGVIFPPYVEGLRKAVMA
jgi:methylthioribose-1-phosphate isomerase